MNYLNHMRNHTFVVVGIMLGLSLGEFLSNSILGLDGMASLILVMATTVTVTLMVSIIQSNMGNKSKAKLLHQLQNVVSGNTAFDKELEQQSEPMLRQLVSAYNKIVGRVSSSLKAFKTATNELAFTASHMADVTERTEANIRRQQLETDQVATAMNEMSATVEEVARSATDASQAAQQANEAATNGVNIALKTKSDIESLVEDVENSSNVISHLAKESENIGAVLDVIKGIAEQTNLLALNAAIEAARAGEQGRGFAVVADEVRTLASRTQASTSEIENMIGRLQAGVSNAESAMQASLEKGKLGSSQVENTLNALDLIMQAVGRINDMNAQIATAAEEQSQVANEINRNIYAISQVADQTTHDAHESRQTSEKLAGISMNINKLMKDFDMGGEKGLDLSSAKAAHLNWKTRLRSFLDGGESLTIEQAVSHKHCDFGKWYYSKGLSEYGNINAIVDVEKPHEELHKTIKTIIELKNEGKVLEAEEAYKKVADISGKIVSLLDTAEMQANSTRH